MRTACDDERDGEQRWSRVGCANECCSCSRIQNDRAWTSADENDARSSVCVEASQDSEIREPRALGSTLLLLTSPRPHGGVNARLAGRQPLPGHLRRPLLALAHFVPILPRARSAAWGRRKWLRFSLSVVTILLVALATYATYAVFYAVYHSPVFEPATASAPAADVMRGVNIGGWLVLEAWVTPSLFYLFLCVGGECPADRPPVIDERSFCDRLGPDEARRRLDAFRDEWVTEATFADIARAGLNTVRIPFGYWVFGDTDLCPSVPSIHHLDNAVQWAAAHGPCRSSSTSTGCRTPKTAWTTRARRRTRRLPTRSRCGAGRRSTAPRGSRRPTSTTRAVLKRVAVRYANEAAVVRIGMVNEPMLMDRAWCDTNCPMPLDDLVGYYNETWAQVSDALAAATAPLPSTKRPVLDIGLGGDPKKWAAMARSPTRTAGDRAARGCATA